MSSIGRLQSLGLLNVETPDLRDLLSQRRDSLAIYCSSTACASESRGRKGRLVMAGRINLRRCPRCNSASLFYESVSTERAARLRTKLGIGQKGAEADE
jgi:hypothetical protein